MATFKVCVRKRRNDGFYPVYIRVTQRKKIGYIKTDKIVSEEGLRAGEVVDPFVMKYCSDRILEYAKRLNRVNSGDMLLQEVMALIQQEDEEVSFSAYARRYHDRMVNENHERNARNYELAYQHLERYAGTTNLLFSQLTSTFVNAWLKTLMTTRRAKEMYPVCIRQIFKEAQKELNDYDRGVIRIKTNPWVKVEIPKADTPEQRAITAEECRAFFAAPLPESKFREPLPELGRDVAMMVLCLGGMNSVDIYNLQKQDYYDGVLHYHRAKTMHSRTDKAYMEMRVPAIIQPLVEKYMAEPDDPFLFSFHKRHSTSDSFAANANTGIRAICESMEMPKEKYYCLYSFRHTWGTVAQNDCGASISEVAFGMNHSNGNRITRGYVKIDFTPAWELNEKVIEFIFFTDKQSHRLQKQENVFGKFSPKNQMKGTVYFMGKNLGEVQDIGYNNVDEIINALIAFIPEDMPKGCIVQFKVENLDKKQTAVYSKQKGKGF